MRYQRTAQRITSAVNCRPLNSLPCRMTPAPPPASLRRRVYPIRTRLANLQQILLGCEVLLVGGAAGVADQGRGHGDTCTLGLPSVIASAYHLCETLGRLVLQPLAAAVGSSAGRSPCGQPS